MRAQPLEFPASPAVSPQLQDLLTRMLAKVCLPCHPAFAHMSLAVLQLAFHPSLHHLT